MERTDFERFSEPPVPLRVVLGGREFALAIQAKGRTAQFRKKLRGCLGDVEELGALLRGVTAAVDPGQVVQLGELPLERIAGIVLHFLGDGANAVLDLIYEYDPALASEREWIEEHAYDSEVCTALVEVVKVVFGPFLRVLLPGVQAESLTGGSTKAED